LLLRTLAICWQVSEDHGSSLIPALEAALEAHTDREQIRFEIANQLAGPKTAAVTLAILPILTLFLGQTLGIDTFSWVFSSWLTLAILMIGVSLLTAGTFLMLQLTKTIEKDLG
jgi:tight adherence protein B